GDLLHRQIQQVAQSVGGVVALVHSLDPVEHLGQHVLHLRGGGLGRAPPADGTGGRRWGGRPRGRGGRGWRGGGAGGGGRGGVGRGVAVPSGRSAERRAVFSSGDRGGTSRPLVRCGSGPSRAIPTSGLSGPSVWLTGSTIAGMGGRAAGSGATTGVPIGVGRGLILVRATS